MRAHQRLDQATDTNGCCGTPAIASQGPRAACCSPTQQVGQATDPICGMQVDPSVPPGGSVELEGVIYAFCSTFCREKFVDSRAGRPGA